MFDHVSIGVRDLARAQRFYDGALGALGHRRLHEDAGSLGYGSDAVVLWILKVERPVPADAGSGLHFCCRARTRQDVDRFHAAALAAGGRDNGPPGLRADYGPNYYAAFVVDPDGYRFEAYCNAA
jgi:catechol 2,3-dioxygenase-like lactoylglutathione lyase family enzyme